MSGIQPPAPRARRGVARQCDFANPAHFSRTFGRIVGRSPGEFRACPVRVADDMGAASGGDDEVRAGVTRTQFRQNVRTDCVDVMSGPST